VCVLWSVVLKNIFTFKSSYNTKCISGSLCKIFKFKDAHKSLQNQNHKIGQRKQMTDNTLIQRTCKNITFKFEIIYIDLFTVNINIIIK